MATYALLSALIIGLASGLLIKQFKQITRERQDFYNQKSLDHIQTLSNQISSWINRQALLAYINPNISKIRTLATPSNMDYIQAGRDLNRLISATGYIESIYVYNGINQYVFTTGPLLSGPLDRFPDQEVRDLLQADKEALPLKPWFRIVDVPSHQNQAYLSYLLTSYDKAGSLASAMVINSSLDWFKQLVKADLEGQVIAIFQGADLLFTSPLAGQEEDLAGLEQVISKLVQEKSMGPASPPQPHGQAKTVRLNKEDYSLYFQPIEASSFYYLSLIKESDLFKDIYVVRNRFYLISVLVICLGGLSIILLYRRYYKPFRRLLVAIDHQDASLGNLDSQVLSLIDQALAAESNRQISNRFRRIQFMDQVLNASFFQGQDGFSKEDFFQEAGQLGLDLKEDLPFYLVLSDQAESLINPQDTAFYWQQTIDDLQIYILQLATVEDWAELCRTLRHNYLDSFIAWSSPCYDLAALNRSFYALLEIRNIAYFSPQQVFAEDYLKSKNNRIKDVEQSIQDLLRSAHELEETEIRPVLDDWFRQLADYRWGVISYALKQASESLTTSNDHRLINEYLAKPGPIDPIKNTFYQGLIIRHRSYLADRQAQHRQLSQEVIEIIDQNLADFNLNLKNISGQIGLSAEYTGKIFKDANGLSVSQYINKVRLAKAGELLLTSDLTVKEISHQVGIENDQYFYKLFKNKYGLTPSQYRNEK